LNVCVDGAKGQRMADISAVGKKLLKAAFGDRFLSDVFDRATPKGAGQRRSTEESKNIEWSLFQEKSR